MEYELEQMRIRLAEMAAEIERLNAVIDAQKNTAVAASIAKEVVDRVIGKKKEALELAQLRAENETLNRENAHLTINNECLRTRTSSKGKFDQLHFALLFASVTFLIALFFSIDLRALIAAQNMVAGNV